MKKNNLRKTARYLAAVFCLFVLSNASVLALPAEYDFDGDGRTDPTIRRSESNGSFFQHIWFTLRSRDGFSATMWGRSDSNSTDIPQIGDYDGDGKADIAVWRYEVQNSVTAPAYWYVLQSSDNNYQAVQWGVTFDRQVPQDYDGDGKTDFAVFRSGWWYILNSRDGSVRAEKFGQDSDEPKRGDYDGDGKADLTVRRGGFIYTLRSGDGKWQGFDFSNLLSGGFFTPGDYDGDGKTDYAFWSGQCEFGNGRWTIIRSSDNQYEQIRFGLPCTDDPVQGDYDGDGRTDIAVYRRGSPNNPPSYFYILRSRDGFQAIQWGGYRDAAPAERQSVN